MKSKINDIDIEKRKILFQYACVLLFSLVLGSIFALILKDGAILIFAEPIRKHFAATFPKDKQLYGVLFSAVYYAFPSLLFILFTFFCSFSTFNYIASELAIFCEGLGVAFCSVVLYRCIVGYELLPISRLLWFVFFKVVFLLLFAVYLYGLAVYSIPVKKFSSLNRASINLKALCFLSAYALAGAGSAVLLGLVYCVVIFIL